MKFGTFVFPSVADPRDDGRVIAEALAEATRSEELGMDAVWLAEHHFDGMCAYVDPVVFAAALARETRRVKLGFAVVQASLHHPLRLAEQLNLLDHLSNGRFIAGLGKGSMYNDYEYEAFEIDPADASARFDELEEILLKCWTNERVAHRGRFWDFEIPALRPRPLTQPHPLLLRALGSEASAVKQGKTGRPFLLAGPMKAVLARAEQIRRTMQESGFGAAHIADAFARSWAWQHVVVADTDREAQERGMGAVRGYIEYRERLGLKSTLAGIMRAGIAHGGPPPGYIFGAPKTVAEQLAAFGPSGLGGLILRFDIGPRAAELSRASLELFAREVAPLLRAAQPAKTAAAS
ncbi:MAG TPA: LLM class flavin-dependent oxidoreductase [Stellaceae bacterium]|nr:LLM class flavin-dependent oxidoreductase [Stellaceae bacterium]